MSIAPDEIRRLSVTERLKLLDDIWESLCEGPGALPLTDAQAREIDRRLEAYKRLGDRGVSLEELDARLEAE